MKRTAKLPVVTFALIGITCIVMIIMRLFLPLTNTAEQAIFMGAYYKPFILAGEWWRMMTVLLVHGSIGHLLANCLSLLSLGIILETMVFEAPLPDYFNELLDILEKQDEAYS